MTASATLSAICDPAYPDVCIASPPPDLDCKDVSYRKFRVLSPDPHNFDGDGNGLGCEAP
jgi:micrococcal nuclease